MPTFTAIALDNLLESRVGHPLKKPSPEENGRRSRHLYISPTLYATPEQAPIPDFSFPEQLSPSPYVANHKRRGGGHVGVVESRRCSEETEVFGVEEDFVGEDVDGVGEAEDLESLDGRSEVEAADLSQIQMESRSFVSAQGEFFDAIDEFSSDGSISNTPLCERRVAELHSLRLNLFEQIEKRKVAEEALSSVRSQWEKIRILMSEAGLTFPAPSAIGDAMHVENQVLDQISEEVVVARFVSEAVGRGIARAKAAEAASAVNEVKDQEILRLRDRLQYYETVNHEMSQRKLVEAALRHQEKKRRRMWLWSFLGIGVSIGASLAAYAYNSRTGECMSGNADEASSIFPSETSQEH